MRKRFTAFGWATYTVVLFVLIGFASCGESAVIQLPGARTGHEVVKTTSSWDVQDVDTSGDVGRYTSINFDPADGYPAIAYQHAGNTNLKYAKWDGSDWNTQVVDSSCNVGRWASLIFTGSGEPAVAYYSVSTTALKFAWFHEVGGMTRWYIETLDGASEGQDRGEYCSLSGLGSGVMGISYYDADRNSLRYVEYSSGSWGSSVEVDYPGVNGDVGMYTSLAPDPNNSNYPAISYYDETNGNLKYAYYDGSDWNTETAYTGGNDDVGLWTSLDFDSEGNPSIAFYNATDTDPGWVWNEDGEGWDFHSLGDGPGGHNIGQYISQDWKAGSSVGFAYYDATDGELIYTEYYPALLMISSVTVAEGDDMGKWADFKYKTYDDPRFSFYNDTDNDCQYAELAE